MEVVEQMVAHDLATTILSRVTAVELQDVTPKKASTLVMEITSAVNAWRASGRDLKDAGTEQFLASQLANLTKLASFAVADAATAGLTRSREAFMTLEAAEYMLRGASIAAAKGSRGTATAEFKAYQKFLVERLGDTYDRSTAGSVAGRSVRSAETQTRTDDCMTFFLADMMGVEPIMVPLKLIADGDTVLAQRDYDRTVALNHETIATTVLDRMGPNLDHAELVLKYAELMQDHTEYWKARSPAPYLSTKNEVMNQDVLAAAALLYQDPVNFMEALFPNCVGECKHFGRNLNLDDELSGAILTILEAVESKANPLSTLYYAMFSALDTRDQLMHGLILMETAGPAAKAEHTAIKVQRLGARQLAIQSGVSRFLQSLHQSVVPVEDHPCWLTGAEPSVVTARMKAYGQAGAESVELGDHQPIGPHTSLAGSRSYDLVAPYIESFSRFEAVTLEAVAYCCSSAVNPVDQEQLFQCSVAAHTEHCHNGAIGVGHVSAALRVAEMLISRDTIDWKQSLLSDGVGLAQHIDLSKWADMSNGGLPKRYLTATNETDSAAFTPAMTLSANMLIFVMMAMSTLHSAVRGMCIAALLATQGVMTVDKRMLAGGYNPDHLDCQCCNATMPAALLTPDRSRLLGADPEAIIMFGNGTVSQGFNSPGSSAATRTALLNLDMGYQTLANGDDQLSKRRMPGNTSQWLKPSHKSVKPLVEPSQGVMVVAPAAVMTTSFADNHGNVAEPMRDAGEFQRAVRAVERMMAGANAYRLNCERTHGFKLGAFAPSPKKCSGGWDDDTTVVFRGIMTGTGTILESINPASALALATIPMRSIPGLCTYLSGVIAGQIVPSGLTTQAADIIRAQILRIAPSLAHIAERENQRTGGQKHLTGKSIWTGALVILDGSDTELTRALTQVANDPDAPLIAQQMAIAGRLLMPKGGLAADNVGDKDEVANALKASGFAKSYFAKRMTHRQRDQSTVHFSEWLRNGWHMEAPINPDVNPDAYSGQPVYIRAPENATMQTIRERTLQPIQGNAPEKAWSSNTMPELGGGQLYPPQSAPMLRWLISSTTTDPGVINHEIKIAASAASIIHVTNIKVRNCDDAGNSGVHAGDTHDSWMATWIRAIRDPYTGNLKHSCRVWAASSLSGQTQCWVAPLDDNNKLRPVPPTAMQKAACCEYSAARGGGMVSHIHYLASANQEAAAHALAAMASRANIAMSGWNQTNQVQFCGSGVWMISREETLEAFQSCYAGDRQKQELMTNVHGWRIPRLQESRHMKNARVFIESDGTAADPSMYLGYRNFDAVVTELNRSRHSIKRMWFGPVQITNFQSGIDTLSEASTQDLEGSCPELGGASYLGVARTGRFTGITTIMDLLAATTMDIGVLTGILPAIIKLANNEINARQVNVGLVSHDGTQVDATLSNQRISLKLGDNVNVLYPITSFGHFLAACVMRQVGLTQ